MKFSNYWSGVLYNIRCCWSNATKVEYSLLSEANFLGVCWKHVQKRICSFRVSWQGRCQYTDGGVVWRRDTWGGDCKGVDFDLFQVWSIERWIGFFSCPIIIIHLQRCDVLTSSAKKEGQKGRQHQCTGMNFSICCWIHTHIHFCLQIFEIKSQFLKLRLYLMSGTSL